MLSNKLNITLKSDVNSINTFFINLLNYASDTRFINIINKVTNYFTNYFTNYNRTNNNSIYKRKIILNNLMMMYNDNNII